MTLPTTCCEFGDVVLVPFPFTDQSTTKKRPAVVVSSDRYHRERQDLIILAVTSQVRDSLDRTRSKASRTVISAGSNWLAGRIVFLTRRRPMR